MQAYSQPSRENDPHALPDVEYWFHKCGRAGDECLDGDYPDEPCPGAGWYYWFCFPGCLPDSEPIGPFATEAECIADFQADAAEWGQA